MGSQQDLIVVMVAGKWLLLCSWNLGAELCSTSQNISSDLAGKSCTFLTSQRSRGEGRDLRQLSKSKVLPFLTSSIPNSLLVLILSFVLTVLIHPISCSNAGDHTRGFLLGSQDAPPLSFTPDPHHLLPYNAFGKTALSIGEKYKRYSVIHVALQQSSIVILSFCISEILWVFIVYPICFVSYHLVYIC